MFNIFLLLIMFEIFLVSSRDTSHSQFGIGKTKFLLSCGNRRDIVNFTPCHLVSETHVVFGCEDTGPGKSSEQFFAPSSWR